MILPGFGQSATQALCSTASIADAGYVALVLSHRGARGSGGRNECLADADFAAAAAWLAQHPAVDSNRIGIWGHSHGGRAALLAAARSDVPKAVVAYYTAPDLEKQQRGPLGTREACARRDGTVTASPILMADRMNASILFVQGDRDVRTPIEDVRAMHQKLLDAGKESRIHVIRGAGHGFFAADWVEARTAMLGHFAEQLAAPELRSELPIPADFEVASPETDTPPGLAALSGVWKLDGDQRSIIAVGVERVRADGTASILYAYIRPGEAIHQGRYDATWNPNEGILVFNDRGTNYELSARDEETPRDAVRKVQRWGYRESIKVYSTLPREAFFAMAEEVRQRGMDIVGHVPMLVTAAEASDAGQRSIEHLTGISLSCADNEATLRPQIAAAVAALTGPATPQHRATFIRSEIDPIFDPAGRKCRALFEKFVTNGTYLVPTLTILARVERARDAADPRLRYVHPRNVQFWLKHEPWPVGDRLYQRARATVAAAHESGVKIMAGTDTVFSGFSLHDELAELVSAGLSPMDALVTATRRPAEFLGELDVAGTIEVGKRADLVLLDANPLEDIGNTKKISAVVLRGRHLDRAALDALLEHAKAHR